MGIAPYYTVPCCIVVFICLWNRQYCVHNTQHRHCSSAHCALRCCVLSRILYLYNTVTYNTALYGYTQGSISSTVWYSAVLYVYLFICYRCVIGDAVQHHAAYYTAPYNKVLYRQYTKCAVLCCIEHSIIVPGTVLHDAACQWQWPAVKVERASPLCVLYLTALEEAEIIPSKHSDTRIKPFPLANGQWPRPLHGRYTRTDTCFCWLLGNGSYNTNNRNKFVTILVLKRLGNGRGHLERRGC